MGVTLSLILIAVGAVLRFAVTADLSEWDLQTTGVILMIVGGVGLVLSLVFWSTWGGFASRRRTTTVIDDTAPVDVSDPTR